MLTVKHGYRPPSGREIARAAVRHAKNRLNGAPSARSEPVVQASLICGDPLISYSGMSGTPLGLASHLPRLPRDHKAWFLISPTWSIEDRSHAKHIRTYAIFHRLRNPSHSLLFMCNTRAEADLLRDAGEAAFLHNKTCASSEHAFRPLDGAPVEFDAIYNAQLAPWKRHELALGVERCAFLFYRDKATTESEKALIDRHARLAPGHVFLNSFDGDGRPVRQDPVAVNRHLNRAAVGLCLSEVEGPMFACTEYLLAGLPVVTTPNRGGRDGYLDADYCLTVPPDPRSVAEAVSALKARRVPRAHIRTRTLARLTKDRERFTDLVNAVLAEGGSPRRIGETWPFRHPVMEWLPAAVAVERALAGRVDAFAGGRRGYPPNPSKSTVDR